MSELHEIMLCPFKYEAFPYSVLRLNILKLIIFFLKKKRLILMKLFEIFLMCHSIGRRVQKFQLCKDSVLLDFLEMYIISGSEKVIYSKCCGIKYNLYFVI